MAAGVEIETATGEVALAAGVGARARRAPPAPPPAAAPTCALPTRRSPLWVEALAIAWLCWIYDAINNLAPVRLRAALAHGWGLLRLERSLGLDPEVTLNRWLIHHHTLGLLLSDYYDNAHFIVTLGLLGWLWWRRADSYRPLRNTLVAINAIGFVVFWLYPTAPPRLLVGAGFSDVVASTHALGGWHTGPLSAVANQFAAMPSLHMGWAVWCSLVLWRLSAAPSSSADAPTGRASPRAKLLRVTAIVYPCITCVAVLATGNHYLLDVLAGVATTVLAVALVRTLEAAWRARGAPRPARASV
jgi:PAP2 superfamily